MSIAKSLKLAVRQSTFRVCGQCGKEKPETAFYAGMGHCKVCRNAGVERDRWCSAERMFGDPSEEQIAGKCAAIRASWTPSEARKRKSLAWLTRRAERMAASVRKQVDIPPPAESSGSAEG